MCIQLVVSIGSSIPFVACQHVQADVSTQTVGMESVRTACHDMDGVEADQTIVMTVTLRIVQQHAADEALASS
jgi:hypothetical protein